jgi:hypothetical protein
LAAFGFEYGLTAQSAEIAEENAEKKWKGEGSIAELRMGLASKGYHGERG